MKVFGKIKDQETIIGYNNSNFSENFDRLPANTIYNLSDIGGMGVCIPAYTPIKEEYELIRFKSGKIAEVLKLVGDFFKPETKQKYVDLKDIHKMGIVLYGPPGTGKSCTATLIMRELVEKYNAICLDATSTELITLKNAIKQIRSVQDNPIVAFIDEIDADFSCNEHAFLPFLDGNQSVNNFILLGCTNNLEKIPDRIKNRKSRVKYCIEIKSFPIEVYQHYISDKLPKLKKEQISEFAYKCEEKGLTIDQCKHAVIDFYIDGVSIDDAIKQVLV